MTVWCHLPTIFNQRYALRSAGLLTLCVALITTLFFTSVLHAAPGINKTLSFQGRLLRSNGGVVPDGHYNIQFKIYQDGAGTTAGNTGGTLKWTETYVNNNGDNGVEVKNGYFSANLGSVNPFGTSVDWDQDTLFLSMNVAGSAAGCTSFNTAPCAADGEMLPMKRITATPYALNAGQLGGKTASNFVQLGQGVQEDASSNSSSIFINKTASGNLVQLQNAATDIFTVNNTGDLTLGSNSDKTISIATAADDATGNNLSIKAGNGGNGTGANGGDLILQGGNAGGTDGNGGVVVINSGHGTGSGSSGTIYIGSSNDAGIQIGSTNLASGTQTIVVGTNANSGSTSNVVVGSTGTAGGGTTTIQAKDAVTIKTDGTTRATFSDSTNTVYFGNGVSSSTPNDFTLQGTDSSAAAIAGGSLTIQGGNATTGNTNGGNVTISGGTGSGTGANGLVVLGTPTFSTVANDANCYTSGAVVATSCTIAASTVNTASAVLVGFSTGGQAATLPDPTITTAGRIIYVMAAGSSQDFTLRANVGGGAGVEQAITMRKNTTATLIWNGSDWTAAGSSSTTTLQDTYDNTPQDAGGAELVLRNSTSTDGLTIRDSSDDPINGTLLEIQSSSAAKVFSVNSNVTEYATNAGAETAGSSSGTFPDETWGAAGTSSITRHTTAGNYIASGKASARIDSSATLSGAYNMLSTALAPSASYNVSMSVRLDSSSDPLTDLGVFYAPDGATPSVTCTSNVTITTDAWKKVTCSFQTPSSGINSSNLIAVGQAGSGTHRYYIDNLSVTKTDNAAPNVQVGGGTNGGPATLFTLDKSAAAPTASTSEALLGSMYYDTDLGKVQCYEAEGWGTCGASPDTFVTISPQYTNAVMNGTDIGTISSDLCSDTLNINDGSSSQPTICGTNETYNFYKWTSAESTNQTRSIFVTYQLPATFKEFVAGSTSLMGRTDSSNSSVTYQVYRDNGDGLTSCGSAVSTSTGSQSTWQKATAAGGADPSACDFEAGDSIMFRINLTAKSDANAYVSNLGFTFSNN